MDVRPMLVQPLKWWIHREQIRLAGGTRQRLSNLRDWNDCGYQHPLLALVLILLLMHVPRPLVRVFRLWTSCEIQPSNVATRRVCRAICYPIGGLGLQLLLLVLADCNPLRHAGRVRRARGCGARGAGPIWLLRRQRWTQTALQAKLPREEKHKVPPEAE